MQEKSSINEYLKNLKIFNKRGRCLYPNSQEDSCNEIINAHSIQKSGILEDICFEGHAYGINRHFGNTVKKNGRTSLYKIGIKDLSIFRGFCKKHDNELFKAIDNNAFIPNKEQSFLYSYRSLCRELWGKENSIAIFQQAIENEKDENVRNYLKDILIGTIKGVEIIKVHKTIFDKCLVEKDFNDIHFCSFNFSEKPKIAFSGISFPDYNYLGNKLQDFIEDDFLQMFTFCSVQKKQGWSYVFTWHKSSNEVAGKFLTSLETIANNTGKLEDHLFRLIFTCDNFAINSSWWDNLKSADSKNILEYLSYINNPQNAYGSGYLQTGLEGISDWNFQSINQS